MIDSDKVPTTSTALEVLPGETQQSERLRTFDALGHETTPEANFAKLDQQVFSVTHEFDNAEGLGGNPVRGTGDWWLEVANNGGRQVARVNGFFKTSETCASTRDDLIGALRTRTEAAGGYMYFVNTMKGTGLLGSNDL